MKKIIYSLLFAVALSSCYEDKGNYDYKLDSMNEITSVSFSPSIIETAGGKVIEVQQALDETDTYRKVEVLLEQTLQNNLEELQFNWFRTYTDADGKSVKDTIHSKGFLEWNLPVGKAMEYNIFLQIYDNTTTLSHYSQFKIKTRPIFKNSLFVLHGEEGNRKLGNIEVIGNETKVRTDIMSITPENDYSNAVGLSYTTFYDLSTGRFAEANTLTVYNKEGGTKAYNPYGMSVKFVTNEIFKPENGNENFIFKKMIQTGDASNYTVYRVALSENGAVYVGNYIHSLYKPGYSYEIYGGDLEHQSDYEITAATITDSRYIFWDAKNNRFLYSAKTSGDFAQDEVSSLNSELISYTPVLDAHIDFTTLANSPKGMTAVLGYINYRESYDTQNAFFIFKDESTGDFYRYELTQIKNSGEKTNSSARENKAAFTIKGEKLRNSVDGISAMPNADISTITYNSWFTTNFLFYSDGKTIYRYSVSSGDNIPVYVAPEGYEITMMKFRTDDAANFTGDLGRILSIALYNGTNGAVAEIKFNTAADIDEDFTPLFYDKDDNNCTWGKIKDLQFTNEYMYKSDVYSEEQ